MHVNNKTRKIVMTALLAALVTAGSYIRIVIPISIAGTTAFHLGNIFCALSGILLGPWMGGLAAGLGSFLFDMLHPLYIRDAWITFLFKGAYGLMAGLMAWSGKHHGEQYGRNVAGAVAGAVTYAFLYLAKNFFYEAIFIQGLEPGPAMVTVLTLLPATIFNAAVAIIFAPVLASGIRKALGKRLQLTT